MKFAVVESKNKKLPGTLEFETVDELIQFVGSVYRISPLKLSAVCEKREELFIYKIIYGNHKIAELTLNF